MKIKINLQRVLLLLLMSMPLIDSINGMIVRDGSSIVNIGQFYRAVVFGILLMLIKYVSRRKAVSLLITFLIFIIAQVAVNISFGINNAVMCLKLFVPLFMIVVFEGMIQRGAVSYNQINKVMEGIAWLIPFTIIVPYILGMGYGVYDDETGYLGFYYAVNEVSFALDVCIMFLITKLAKKIKIKYLLIMGLNIIAVLFVGTKSALAVMGTCILIYIWRTFLGKEESKVKRFLIVIAILIMVVIGFVILADNLYAIYNRWLWLLQNHSDESVLYFLTSGRTARITDAWREFGSGSAFQLFFGWGLAATSFGYPNMEMDFIDLLYATGFIGSVVICLFYISFIKKIKRDFYSWIFLFIAFGVIFLGGHVLYYGLGGMMNALLLIYLGAYSNSVENKKLEAYSGKLNGREAEGV